MIKNLVALEAAHINSNHPDFINGGEAIGVIIKRRAELQQAPPDPSVVSDASPEIKMQLEQQKKAYEQRMREEQIRREREELRRQAIEKKEREERERRERENSSKKGFLGFFNNSNASNNSPAQKDSIDPPLMPNPPKVMPKSSSTRNDDETFQIELIELLLTSYFKIVRKNIADRVPKTIMYFMVNASKDKIQNELVKCLYKEEMFNSLLEESDDIAMRREQIRETIEVLSSAQRILNEIIDYKIN
jgi:dynamin 1-like protein